MCWCVYEWIYIYVLLYHVTTFQSRVDDARVTCTIKAVIHTSIYQLTYDLQTNKWSIPNYLCIIRWPFSKKNQTTHKFASFSLCCSSKVDHNFICDNFWRHAVFATKLMMQLLFLAMLQGDYESLATNLNL